MHPHNSYPIIVCSEQSPMKWTKKNQTKRKHKNWSITDQICLVWLLFTSVKLPGAIWSNSRKNVCVHMWKPGLRLHTNNGIKSNNEHEKLYKVLVTFCMNIMEILVLFLLMGRYIKRCTDWHLLNYEKSSGWVNLWNFET